MTANLLQRNGLCARQCWWCEERTKDLIWRAVCHRDISQFSIVCTHVKDSGSIRLSLGILQGKEGCPSSSNFFPDWGCLYLDIILLNLIFNPGWCVCVLQIPNKRLGSAPLGLPSAVRWERLQDPRQCCSVTNNALCLFCSGQSSPAKAAASSPSHEGESATVTPSVKSLASAVLIMPASVKKVRTMAPARAAQSSQPRTHPGFRHTSGGLDCTNVWAA